MVDRVELFLQVFWLCVIFWLFFINLVYKILPYIGFTLKISELKTKFSEVVVKNKEASKNKLKSLLLLLKDLSKLFIKIFIQEEVKIFSEI